MLFATANSDNVPEVGISVMAALLLFIAASVWLGTVAQKAMQKKEFLKSFFLGNRGLGAWTLALTATVQSGGTFMGFPSLVYSFGWIVALWIASYMVVPLTGFAVVGKRLAQLSRQTNAVTVPDLLRERFGDARVGLVASLMIMTFLSFTMFAQFKAGATIMKHAWPGSKVAALTEDYGTPAENEEGSVPPTVVIDVASAPPAVAEPTVAPPTAAKNQWLPESRGYYIGLMVFSITVVGYTLIGGFMASVWTDLFQSVMMVIGVMLLVCLAVPMAGGLEQASKNAIEATSPDIAFGPGYSAVKDPDLKRAFLTPGLALSMFFVWVFAGFASPASMVRVMAAQNTEVMRKSIFLLSGYNCLIYIPLIMTCIAARTLLPDLEKPDEVIPLLSLKVTENFPFGTGQFVSGLIMAAPFGAIMASVSCFVLVIASGLVEDIYAKFINPNATETQLRRATTISMVAVGLIAILANLNPPKYLQALVVLSGSAGAATFIAPVMMACYWRRATAGGALAGMLSGFLVYFGIYSCGWAQNWATDNPTAALAGRILGWLGKDPLIGPSGMFRPYYILGVDPIIWGLLASVIGGVGVSLLSRPPAPELVKRFFDVRSAAAPSS
jgi:SSS family solute:Na+ symporter/sodium/pantothenate symporter